MTTQSTLIWWVICDNCGGSTEDERAFDSELAATSAMIAEYGWTTDDQGHYHCAECARFCNVTGCSNLADEPRFNCLPHRVMALS